MLDYLTIFLGSIMAPKVLATLGTVLGLILADTIFGILAALKTGTFSLSKLAQFVQTNLVPYVGGLLVLALFTNSNAELSALFFTIAAMITVKFLADIKDKVSQVFGGLNIQIQSPIAVKKDVVMPGPVSVSPQTDVSTNTPASDKTVPAADKNADPEDEQTA